MALTSVLLGVFHPYPLLWIPAFFYLPEFPKFATITSYLTVRADLLPHSEQVVFTKTYYFSETRQIVVNIKDLQKIEADQVLGGNHLFQYNEIDRNFVWQDNQSKEIFIFFKDGQWSEEGLNHPLLN